MTVVPEKWQVSQSDSAAVTPDTAALWRRLDTGTEW